MCSLECFNSVLNPTLCNQCKDAFELFCRATKQPKLFPNIPAWKNLDTASKRSWFYSEFSSKEMQIFQTWKNKTWKSGFQLFVASFKSSASTIQELSSVRSAAWTQMPVLQKHYWNNTANQLKFMNQQYVKKNQSFLRAKFNDLKKKPRQKKPLNSFMMFLKDKWTEHKQAGSSAKYQEIRTLCSELWNNSPQTRVMYSKLYSKSFKPK